MTEGTTQDRTPRRGWIVAGAVTAVATAVVVTTSVVARTGTTPVALPDTSDPAVTDPAGLVLRDGMVVEADGVVVAAPGRPVRFCPALPTLATAPVVGQDEPVPDCPDGLAVTVREVDLDALADPATVRGGWQPGGGARTVDDPAHKQSSLEGYIERHRDQIGQLWFTHPEGQGGADAPEVQVVPVVFGDVDQVRAALTAVYRGNLCVARAPAGMLSQQQTEAIRTRLDPQMTGPDGRIFQDGPDGMGRLVVEFSYLDQPLYERFSAIGLANLVLHPWLHPVR